MRFAYLDSRYRRLAGLANLTHRRRLIGGLSAVAVVAVLASEIVHAPPAPESASVVSPSVSEQASTQPAVEQNLQPIMPSVDANQALPAQPVPQALPFAAPASAGVNAQALNRVDDLLRQGISSGLFPGAAITVVRGGQMIKHEAYGYAALYASPTQRLANPTPAQVDTIFDVASLTKLFTATAIMQLVETGKVRIEAPVSSHIPEFAANGKGTVTVKHLLTHTGGLPPGIDIAAADTPTEVVRKAYQVKPRFAPDTKRLYSDIDFMVLGEIVQRVSGQDLDRYIAEHITAPLGMTDTMYRPDPALLPRIAATEELPGRGMVRGSLHDTVAWQMGGVSGHAGLFSTVSDLAIFGQMMLNGGQYAGHQILSPASVAQMTKLRVPASFHDDVGLGWELNQSWYMGALNSTSTFGHTGYTGTSIVVDPQHQVAVVLLTNRVHPLAKTSVNETRAKVADIVAAAVGR